MQAKLDWGVVLEEGELVMEMEMRGGGRETRKARKKARKGDGRRE